MWANQIGLLVKTLTNEHFMGTFIISIEWDKLCTWRQIYLEERTTHLHKGLQGYILPNHFELILRQVNGWPGDVGSVDRKSWKKEVIFFKMGYYIL